MPSTSLPHSPTTMAQAIASTDQCSQQSHQGQDSTTPSQAYMDVTSQWSEWILDSSGLHYYRARYITYEVASTVITNSRNSIVPDGQGYYIHYEFLGIKELGTTQYVITPVIQPPVLPATSTSPQNKNPSSSATVATKQPAPLVSNDQNGTSSVPREVHQEKSAAGGAYPRIIDIDTTSNGLTISFPVENEKHAIVFDKQARKRLKAEKKVHVNPKAKVHTWLKG